jgi:hypothetical protein
MECQEQMYQSEQNFVDFLHTGNAISVWRAVALARERYTFPRGEGGRAPARSEEEWRRRYKFDMQIDKTVQTYSFS